MIGGVAIIDFGSQFTQLILKKVRQNSVYAEIIDDSTTKECLLNFKCFIISGSPKSVTKASEIVLKILEINKNHNIPILGLCYGAQLISKLFNGEIKKDAFSEFGMSEIKVVRQSHLIDNVWSCGKTYNVWASHSDSIVAVPKEFDIIAYGSDGQNISIFENITRNIYAIQFHPEVDHTENGDKIIMNFLKIAQCNFNWDSPHFMTQIIDDIKEKAQSNKVIMAISGGVDSTVAATIIQKAIGSNIQCIFVNTGLMRKNESEAIENIFKELNIKIKTLDKSKLFFTQLKGIVDPEEKRKIIGRLFIEIFEKESNNYSDATFLAQGTLYSDIIESGQASSQEGAKIKSHHNVGGLPKTMKMKLIEPLKTLFKYEVRELGKQIGLPESIIMRHPFPGPGLAIRIIGEITEEKVRILQNIDAIVTESLVKFDLYDKIWQAFAVLLPINSVGVQGDQRSFGYVCAIRCVNSTDGMTANIFPNSHSSEFDSVFWKYLRYTSNKITNEVREISRVTYDITSKPPATIEWE